MGLLRSWRFSTVCKTVGYAFIGSNPIKPTKFAVTLCEKGCGLKTAVVFKIGSEVVGH